MDHPLIGRPVLDEMGFVANQHLDSVRYKFHLHDFSHVDEELLDIDRQHLGALSSFYSCPRTIQSLLRTCRMCLHWQRKKHDASGADKAERAC
jgi:hypothetical protein